MIDFRNSIELVARIFYGKSNENFSTETELRFGKHGSLCVNLDKGIWYDHEIEKGGTTLDLIIENKNWNENPDAKKLAARWLAGKLKQHQSEFKPRLRRGGISRENHAPEIRNKPVISGYTDKNNISWFKGNQIETIYNYNDEEGNLLYQVLRYIPGPWPRFSQRRPAPDWKGDYWIPNLDGTRRVPYRLNEFINQSGTMFICEGEKDVDNLLKLIRGLGSGFSLEIFGSPQGDLELKSIFATCNPGGCGKWKEEYNKYFTNFNCIILPDNDEPGLNHAEEIKQNIKNSKILILPNLPLKGDINDWIDQGGRLNQLLDLIKEKYL